MVLPDTLEDVTHRMRHPLQLPGQCTPLKHHACIVLALKPVQVPRGLGSLKYCMGILAMVGNNVLADYLLSTEVDM